MPKLDRIDCNIRLSACQQNATEIWLAHNLPETLELYRRGPLDDCFADTHNSTRGDYGGLGILPDVTALNLIEIPDRQSSKPVCCGASSSSDTRIGSGVT